METDYDKLARDLKSTVNHVQFVGLLKLMLTTEYTNGFNKGYSLAKELHNQGYIK